MTERDRLLRTLIIVPLAALSIPILAIMRDTAGIGWAFGGVVLIATLTVAVRSLMNHRHKLRMKEIAAQERLVKIEQEHLASAERVLELDDLQERIRKQEPPTLGVTH